MNGNRIIIVCGIVALLIFIGSTAAGLLTHKKLRDFHQARFARLCEVVPPGITLDDKLRTKLQQDGYEVDSADPADARKNHSVLCHWIDAEKIKRLQTKRLGYPTFAEIRCDGNNTVISVIGREE